MSREAARSNRWRIAIGGAAVCSLAAMPCNRRKRDLSIEIMRNGGCMESPSLYLRGITLLMMLLKRAPIPKPLKYLGKSIW